MKIQQCLLAIESPEDIDISSNWYQLKGMTGILTCLTQHYKMCEQHIQIYQHIEIEYYGRRLFYPFILTKCRTAWKVSKYGVFSGPYFPAFTLNTKRYFISLRIQSECRKTRTRKSSVFGHISHSAGIFWTDKILIVWSFWSVNLV